MKTQNILLDKSLLFAARIVKLHRYLLKEKHESIIAKQIIRSATSIGANANEAVYGISKADFISKLQISLKETAETEYWLRLLILSEYISEKEGESLLRRNLELITLDTTLDVEIPQQITPNFDDIIAFLEEMEMKKSLNTLRKFAKEQYEVDI